MAIDLTEPLVAALHQRLVDDLPAAVAAVNAEVDDGYELAAPDDAQILPYIPPPSDLLSPPTIGVGEGTSRFEDDIGSSATGRHELLIVVYEQTADQLGLALRLRRWARVLTRVALEGRSLPPVAWGTGLVGTAPGPTLVDDADNPREWFSWTGIRIWAKTEEE